MTQFLVIGICIILLLAVIFISAKPISMGIESRRNIKDKNLNENSEEENESGNVINDQNKIKISEEIIKLKELRDNGVLTNEEYERAINKILN
tara:strand:+ start:11919 stop:12197 length:279 start_codon:yes stop_codon:yes gene_type:complete